MGPLPGLMADEGREIGGAEHRLFFSSLWPCVRRCAADAGLEAVVDHYSFIAEDSHHLLLAGLPAHTQ